jgi:hypothetical protein
MRRRVPGVHRARRRRRHRWRGDRAARSPAHRCQAQRRLLLMHMHAPAALAPCDRAGQFGKSNTSDLCMHGMARSLRQSLTASGGSAPPLRLRVVVGGSHQKSVCRTGGRAREVGPRAPSLQGSHRPHRRGCQGAGPGRRGACRSGCAACAVSRSFPAGRLEGSAGALRAQHSAGSRGLCAEAPVPAFRADTPQRSERRRSAARLRARVGCGWSN